MIKLCMIGAGNHATRNIYPYLHWLQDTAVVANCDLRKDQAQKVADRFRIPKSYDDVHEMLKQEKPDAAVVCTGPAGHCAIAIDLLQHGVHVYTEKPTAPSLADALRMLEAQKKSGLVCMTAYKKRFAPAYLKAKKLINDKANFGEPAGMNVTRASASGAMKPEQMRGHMLDWTCHTLDLGVFLLGPVQSVTTTTVDRDGRYAWSVVMRHKSGTVSHQLFTNATGGMPEEEVWLSGSGGVVIKVSNSINLLALKNGKPFEGHFPSFTTGSNFGDVEQGYSGELVEFVNAIHEKREPDANIRIACHALAIFEAMWASAQSGGTPTTVEFQL